MKPVIIHEEAELELWQAVSFYESKVAGLGLDFESQIRRILADIQNSPELHPKKKHGTRCHLTRRFPYAVYYIEIPDAIWIVAFAHTRRRPHYWLGRTHDVPTS